MEKEGPFRATRPTAAGSALLYSEGLLLLAACLTDRPALYAGASLLLALAVVGFLGTVSAARSLEVSWDGPSRVFAAEPFPLRLLVRNRGRIAVTGIEFFPSGSPERTRRPGAVLREVPAGASVPLELATRVRHRGRHRLVPPRIATSWPFGLFRARLAPAEERTVLAYPRRVPVPPRALRSRAPEISAREVAAAVPRGGELLRGVRGWSPGDAPRAIAWRASARHGKLLTREFEREDAGRAVVALDLDTRDLRSPASVRADAVERACSLATSLVLRLRAEGRRTALVLFDPEPVVLLSLTGERSLGRALETLALVESPGRSEPRRDPLSLLPPAALRGARVLLVKAAIGSPSTARGPHGSEVITLPALHATFLPGRPA
jgi:uncharacterized protein (DUF58 family)